MKSVHWKLEEAFYSSTEAMMNKALSGAFWTAARQVSVVHLSD